MPIANTDLDAIGYFRSTVENANKSNQQQSSRVIAMYIHNLYFGEPTIIFII